jgi:hypothetical protein
MAQTREIWRQGDVYVARVDESAPAGVPRWDGVLYWGEGTGHAHRVAGPPDVAILEGTATVRSVLGLDFEAIANEAPLFVVSARPFAILHDEHGRLDLEGGTYVVWRQRRYSPLDNRGEFPDPLARRDD